MSLTVFIPASSAMPPYPPHRIGTFQTHLRASFILARPVASEVGAITTATTSWRRTMLSTQNSGRNCPCRSRRRPKGVVQ